MDEGNRKASSIADDLLMSGVNLPPLPAAGAQLLVLSQQPIETIDISKFVKLVETDPSLTTKFLQLANSAYFKTLHKIVSLRQAIVHIGLEEAIQTAYWLLYRNSLPKFPKFEGFSNQDYWSHSWACGVANKMLGHPDLNSGLLPGELYISGLLHGIGKLILAIHKPKEFLQCLEISREFSQSLADAQFDVLGTTDSFIASEILKRWQFPENICMAVKHYQAPENADEKYRLHAGLTQFAYYLANTSGIGNINDELCYDLTQTWIVQEGRSPLAQEDVRHSFSSQIYAALQKKAQSFTTFEDNTEADKKKLLSKNAHEAKKKKQKKTPSQKKGFFYGFLTWLRSLFT